MSPVSFISSRRPLALLTTFVLLLAAAVVAMSPASASAAGKPWTIPALKQWSPAAGSFTFDRSTRVVVQDAALRTTARTFAADLSDLSGRSVAVTTDSPRKHDIALRLDKTVTPAAEGYALAVDDVAVLRAATDAGAFLATRSMLQLLRQGDTVPAGTARDWPDYPYRGITLCNCVKYFSVPWLKRLIRDMSYLKYNVLHLEMRVASDAHPENNSKTNPLYTPEQVAEIAAFGARYHVEVSQQTPSPGHMDYYLSEHPELQAADADGKRNPQNIDMADPAAWPYLKSIIDEQMPLLPGKQWYGGGDEYLNTPALYENYPSLVEWAKQRSGPDAPAADSFVLWQNKVAEFVADRGRTLHLWNDQLFTGMPTKLDPDVVIDYWIKMDGRMSPAQIVANGNDIVNASDSMYFVNDNPPDAAWIYEQFTPNLFSGGQTVPADDPHLLGAKMGLWPGAHGQSEVLEEQKLFGPLRALAQKNWGGTPPAATYADFKPVMTAIGHAPGYLQPGPLAGGKVYTLRAGDDSYATLSGAADRTGSVVSSSKATGAAARWLVTADDYGQYSLRSAADGRCAAVSSDSYNENAPVVTTECDPAAANQKWLLEKDGSGFVLRSDSSGRVLTSDGGSGKPLVQRFGTGGAEQRWVLDPAASQVTATFQIDDGVVPAGAKTGAGTVITNHGGTAVSDVVVELQVPDGYTATAETRTRLAYLAPGAKATVRWQVTVPDQVAAGFDQLHTVAAYRGPRATFQVGATDTLMATDASVRDAVGYTADFTSHTVTPITLATGTPHEPIKVGTLPGTIAGDADGDRIYVANQGSASVTVIDAATKAVTATVPVGTTPAGLGLSPDGKTLWVSAYSDNAVQAIDLATLTAGPLIKVAAGPENLAVSPDGKTLWVACRTDNQVVPVDIGSGTAGTPVPVADGPNGLAITPDGKTVYVTQQWSDTVVPIDTATRAKGSPITVGRTPFKLRMSPDGKTLAVASENDRSLYFVDTASNTVRQTVLVGPMPSDVSFSSTGTLAYASVASNNTVVPIILPSGETGPPIPVGGYPIGITIGR
ncbi:family 20 glycosylhydrolase [Streptomyces sporangiiformans]|uniref:Ricin B lectin domain-containing protein n=1 Tax=Streptomyces sporangiiformans TaxID=2315329 RepID=A0A505DHY1_9ACTN|nr:family 20 glycosylhydrolase [Streptomyces sporangiiformans]TPQ21425.1 hypothetical protein FGD71_015380 [Streptomyces sporangiiformans]